MAKTSVIKREQKRIKVRDKYKNKRLELKEAIRLLQKDPMANYELLQERYKELRALPRNASPIRVRNRCRLTGRPRGFYRKVGLSRNMFRLYAMLGEIPGLVKSSW